MESGDASLSTAFEHLRLMIDVPKKESTDTIFAGCFSSVHWHQLFLVALHVFFPSRSVATISTFAATAASIQFPATNNLVPSANALDDLEPGDTAEAQAQGQATCLSRISGQLSEERRLHANIHHEPEETELCQSKGRKSEAVIWEVNHGVYPGRRSQFART